MRDKVLRVRGDTLMTPDHTTISALGRVEPELVGLPGKALTRDATRTWCCS